LFFAFSTDRQMDAAPIIEFHGWDLAAAVPRAVKQSGTHRHWQNRTVSDRTVICERSNAYRSLAETAQTSPSSPHTIRPRRLAVCVKMRIFISLAWRVLNFLLSLPNSLLTVHNMRADCRWTTKEDKQCPVK
jgi:hypothetical protein